MRLLEGVFFATFLSLFARALTVTSDSSDATLAWSNQVLAAHNAARARYGVRPLSWNSNLYPGALDHAEACRFAEGKSDGTYGENLEASSPPSDIYQAVTAWMQEASKYNYNHPGYSRATGHFTQVIWEGTTHVACAIADCAAGEIFSQPSSLVVCRYSPAGNIIGEFDENVPRRV